MSTTTKKEISTKTTTPVIIADKADKTTLHS